MASTQNQTTYTFSDDVVPVLERSGIPGQLRWVPLSSVSDRDEWTEDLKDQARKAYQVKLRTEEAIRTSYPDGCDRLGCDSCASSSKKTETAGAGGEQSAAAQSQEEVTKKEG